MAKLIYPELSYLVTGLCFQVQNRLSRFNREKQYADELEKTLSENGVKYGREVELGKLSDRSPAGNRVDFIIEDKIVLELKAKRFVTKEDYFQAQRYLRGSGCELALVVNFRSSHLKPKRVLNTASYSDHSDAISRLGSHSGFTLIELLIVIALTAILAATVAPIYGNLQVSAQLNENSTQSVQYLRTARERAAARYNNAQHGVYFDINSGDDVITLYQGASYAARTSSYDRVLNLDSSMSLSASGFTLTGSDVDVNFSRGLAAPDNIGTLTITHDVSGTRQVVVNSFGLVEEN